jgi:hypothetical protein
VKTLRDWRTDKLLSVRALAEAAAVQHKTIIQIEYGRPHRGRFRGSASRNHRVCGRIGGSKKRRGLEQS